MEHSTDIDVFPHSDVDLVPVHRRRKRRAVEVSSPPSDDLSMQSDSMTAVSEVTRESDRELAQLKASSSRVKYELQSIFATSDFSPKQLDEYMKSSILQRRTIRNTAQEIADVMATLSSSIASVLESTDKTFRAIQDAHPKHTK
eukprot:gnl/Dysnectes_brevis/3292_a4130_1565.p1 GENE.gnl/Dysnectes_brevis/3292_a4130_1565~~gnl/Dysnectes_brevis/3292_a4130_1565.p1  ORF type:complete len:144 (+),score=11.07 gnl/Dysnectes_brevis/3292_a4130_1565:58-489(+)